ncbi:unnamed protein product [Cylicostephanus goldi]|uniref:Immunoglobulin I-set domain-containing protein n=1 Tax=Cylicostephanus goldi TaxID=71465 RepID=A0A3P7P6H6_CYLGO|nr:unnamed protein product [Cylicostephanus goldi]
MVSERTRAHEKYRNPTVIHCNVYGNLERIPLADDRCRQTLHHGFATLDIIDSTKDDSGVFTCRAINKLGQAENQATVIVHPRVDLHNYEANRHLDVDDVREIQFSHAKQDETPKFLSPVRYSTVSCD